MTIVFETDTQQQLVNLMRAGGGSSVICTMDQAVGERLCAHGPAGVLCPPARPAVATAIANAESRAALTASRARIVAAASGAPSIERLTRVGMPPAGSGFSPDEPAAIMPYQRRRVP